MIWVNLLHRFHLYISKLHGIFLYHYKSYHNSFFLTLQITYSIQRDVTLIPSIYNTVVGFAQTQSTSSKVYSLQLRLFPKTGCMGYEVNKQDSELPHNSPPLCCLHDPPTLQYTLCVKRNEPLFQSLWTNSALPLLEGNIFAVISQYYYLFTSDRVASFNFGEWYKKLDQVD